MEASLTLPEIPDHLLEEIFLRLPTPQDLARTSAAWSRSADSSPPAHSSADSAVFTRRHSSASSTSTGSISLCRLTPPRPRPMRSPSPPTSPSPSSPPTANGPSRTSATAASCLNASTERTRRISRSSRSLWCATPCTGGTSCSPSARSDFSGAYASPASFHPTMGTLKRLLSEWSGWQAASLIWPSSSFLRALGASQPWRDLFIGGLPLHFLKRHFASGCIYWVSPMNKKELLVFDTTTMEFSIADFPPGEWRRQLHVAIVDAGEGRLGMFSTHDTIAGNESILRYMVRQNKGESSGRWDVKTISLGHGYRHIIRPATGNNLILSRTDVQWPDVDLSLPQSMMIFFSLDVKTMQLERMFAQHNQRSAVHIYTNFPPSLLSSPTV